MLCVHNLGMEKQQRTYGYDRVMTEVGVTKEIWDQFRGTVMPTGVSLRNMLGKLVMFYLTCEPATRALMDAQRLPLRQQSGEEDRGKPAPVRKGVQQGSSRSKTNGFPSWMSGVRVPSPAVAGRDYSGALGRDVPESVPR